MMCISKFPQHGENSLLSIFNNLLEQLRINIDFRDESKIKPNHSGQQSIIYVNKESTKSNKRLDRLLCLAFLKSHWPTRTVSFISEVSSQTGNVGDQLKTLALFKGYRTTVVGSLSWPMHDLFLFLETQYVEIPMLNCKSRAQQARVIQIDMSADYKYIFKPNGWMSVMKLKSIFCMRTSHFFNDDHETNATPEMTVTTFSESQMWGWQRGLHQLQNFNWCSLTKF